MKLAFIADGRSPTTQGWISLFTERGHDVHLLSTFRCAPLPAIASLNFISVAFSGMGKQGEKGEFRTPGGTQGIGLRSVMRHWLGPYTLPRAARHVRKILETLDVDLVHSLRIPFEGMLGALAHPEIPLVASVWGNDFTLHARSSPGMNYYTRQTLRRVDALHADCKRDIRLAADWGFQPHRPTVVLPGGGGVVRGLFKPASPEMASLGPEVRKQVENLPKDCPIVVNPRGFRAYVRNDTFFRSIPGVIERVPGTIFLCPAMAGNEEASRWIAQLKIEQSVRLLPKLSQKEMAMVYRMSKVMVSPSEHDGTPNTFLEAIACGCFPVMGDLESLREWVVDGENGFLVDSDDPYALAQATSRALLSAELREKASKVNQDLVDERADRDRVVISAERFYKQVVEMGITGGREAEG
ncbi:MAG: glycosyltransferase family 4 protein [Anaerolineales bacterium]|nr:glycosyltransferase family 4 protein [Anaerolineales bacterium]